MLGRADQADRAGTVAIAVSRIYVCKPGTRVHISLTMAVSVYVHICGYAAHAEKRSMIVRLQPPNAALLICNTNLDNKGSFSISQSVWMTEMFLITRMGRTLKISHYLRLPKRFLNDFSASLS